MTIPMQYPDTVSYLDYDALYHSKGLCFKMAIGVHAQDYRDALAPQVVDI